MSQATKDRIVIVLCFIALIVAFYFLGKSEKVQAKIDEIIGQQDVLYAMARQNMQGAPNE